MEDIVVSLKANDARWIIDAYKIFAAQNDYPLHLGVTEAGCGRAAVINSWLGWEPCCKWGLGIPFNFPDRRRSPGSGGWAPAAALFGLAPASFQWLMSKFR